jgi:hypothetical protein
MEVLECETQEKRKLVRERARFNQVKFMTKLTKDHRGFSIFPQGIDRCDYGVDDAGNSYGELHSSTTDRHQSGAQKNGLSSEARYQLRQTTNSKKNALEMHNISTWSTYDAPNDEPIESSRNTPRNGEILSSSLFLVPWG